MDNTNNEVHTPIRKSKTQYDLPMTPIKSKIKTDSISQEPLEVYINLSTEFEKIMTSFGGT